MRNLIGLSVFLAATAVAGPPEDVAVSAVAGVGSHAAGIRGELGLAESQHFQLALAISLGHDTLPLTSSLGDGQLESIDGQAIVEAAYTWSVDGGYLRPSLGFGMIVSSVQARLNDDVR